MPEVILKVAMPCGGCKAAVERVLGKLAGVQSFDVSLETQQVIVRGDVKAEDVVATVAKTGKATELISAA